MLRSSINKSFLRHASSSYDLVVIGGGPGGYVAAIKAAQLGLNVACIEKRGKLGGTCLNVGCIPSKSLLNNTQLFHQVSHEAKSRGIKIDGSISIDFKGLIAAKDKSVTALTSGIESLFKKNKVTYIKGEASFNSDSEVSVGEDTITAKDFIIATGSEVTPFPGITIDEERIVSSTGILSLKEVPERLTIIGGGIIGLEMASVYSRIGSKVTIVEFQDSIGAGMDDEVAKSILKILKKQGLEFKLGTKVVGAESDGSVVSINVEKDGKPETLESDVLLVAIGRRPYTKNLNFEKAGLDVDNKGRLIIDNQFKTKKSNIRVIGDVTFGPMLAHKAEEEGIAAVEYIVNGHGHVNYNNIPSVMYTHPEVAWVGLNEKELKEKKIAYNVGKFPFIANSRAKTNLDTDGFVKFLADKETQRVLGVHIIGANAGEMIGEAGLALEYGASTEDIARTCHAHPTLSEAFKEAALATFDKPINF